MAVTVTAVVSVACLHSVAAAMPPEEPADPVCESGAQTTVIDDAGVAHVACVLSDAPPIDTASTTTVVADGLLPPPPQALPKTGRSSAAAALGAALLAAGTGCVVVARRPGRRNAFRARRLTP